LTVLSASKELRLPRIITKMYLDQCVAEMDLVTDEAVNGTRYFRNMFVKFLADAGLPTRLTAAQLAGLPRATPTRSASKPH
jgi:hypothetical protein